MTPDHPYYHENKVFYVKDSATITTTNTALSLITTVLPEDSGPQDIGFEHEACQWKGEGLSRGKRSVCTADS
jgi:hypothetical protein